MFGRRVTEASAAAEPVAPASILDASTDAAPGPSSSSGEKTFAASFKRIRDRLFARINVSAAILRGREQLADELRAAIVEIAAAERTIMTVAEYDRIVALILDEMFGLGPVEPLLADASVTDILINGPQHIYVERRGLLELTNISFRDNEHLTNVAQRIAASVGRRVDETSPTVDARLADGSRVNIVLPPLALDGTCISIRKFAKHRIGISTMVQHGNLSPGMGRLLEIAARCRLNIIVSGGTGSGKTTLLNALSRMIDPGERIITIEDAAELRLQQPHVVRLETRPPNIERSGEINQRDLVKNALRMRPDRIILGEIRGAEAFDVLQAMNTGHDGSMTTLHANTPRDALVRLENMVISANAGLPMQAIRSQIVSAVHLIIQISRMRDGVRRVQQISEVIGIEGEVIILQDLFNFAFEETHDGRIIGNFVSTGLRPRFVVQARYYGLEEELKQAMS
ncbi:CpaF family protein [Geminicoccus roseus]|uniref:CpaF family protein n=1 Tax=Geminicoccus roseus TaxID=404900 RepID=UPI00040628DA|nr:CpaF family protein [Geminicoccus roseus]